MTANNKIKTWILAMLLLVACLFAAVPAMAQDAPADPGDPPADPADPVDPADPADVPDPADTPEDPAFNNPMQEERAANLAAAATAQPNPELEAALDNLDLAETNLTAAELSGDEEAIAAAQADLETAQATADEAMANSGGVSTESIAAMRESGMGWGQIAQELGVHPSTLGMGHTKREQARTAAMKGQNNRKTFTVNIESISKNKSPLHNAWGIFRAVSSKWCQVYVTIKLMTKRVNLARYSFGFKFLYPLVLQRFSLVLSIPAENIPGQAKKIIFSRKDHRIMTHTGPHKPEE